MQGSGAAARAVQEAAGVLDALRVQVEATVERLSRTLVRSHDTWPEEGSREEAHARMQQTQAAVRFYGQVLASWPHLSPEALPVQGAGIGATVRVKDQDTGSIETYTLMTGPLIDIDAAQVSLASPVGQALLGALQGAAIAVQTPQRLRRLYVLEVHTLPQKLRHDMERHSPA